MLIEDQILEKKKNGRKRVKTNTPHRCPEWDYEWITPDMKEWEACICNIESIVWPIKCNRCGKTFYEGNPPYHTCDNNRVKSH